MMICIVVIKFLVKRIPGFKLSVCCDTNIIILLMMVLYLLILPVLAVACDMPVVGDSSTATIDDTTACVQIEITCTPGFEFPTTSTTSITSWCQTDPNNHRGLWDETFENCAGIHSKIPDGTDSVANLGRYSTCGNCI